MCHGLRRTTKMMALPCVYRGRTHQTRRGGPAAARLRRVPWPAGHKKKAKFRRVPRLQHTTKLGQFAVYRDHGTRQTTFPGRPYDYLVVCHGSDTRQIDQKRLFFCFFTYKGSHSNIYIQGTYQVQTNLSVQTMETPI